MPKQFLLLRHVLGVVSIPSILPVDVKLPQRYVALRFDALFGP